MLCALDLGFAQVLACRGARVGLASTDVGGDACIWIEIAGLCCTSALRPCAGDALLAHARGRPHGETGAELLVPASLAADVCLNALGAPCTARPARFASSNARRLSVTGVALDCVGISSGGRCQRMPATLGGGRRGERFTHGCA